MANYGNLSTYTYTPSSNTQKKQKEYEDYKNNQKVADYIFSKQAELDKKENEFNNIEKFTYSPNTDPLYKNYSDRYRAFGKTAMEDEMGKASSLTGGYGNTYSQTAGNQAYGSYLEKMNDVLPELYQLAYSKYSDEIDLIERQLKNLKDDDKTEYGKYTDKVDNYEDMVKILADIYSDEEKIDSENQYNAWKSDAEIQKLADENSYKNRQLSIEQSKINSASSTEKPKKEKVMIDDLEIYAFINKGDYYHALLALENNYGTKTLMTLKGLSYGIPLRNIKQYISMNGITDDET